MADPGPRAQDHEPRSSCGRTRGAVSHEPQARRLGNSKARRSGVCRHCARSELAPRAAACPGNARHRQCASRRPAGGGGVLYRINGSRRTDRRPGARRLELEQHGDDRVEAQPASRRAGSRGAGSGQGCDDRRPFSKGQHPRHRGTNQPTPGQLRRRASQLRGRSHDIHRVSRQPQRCRLPRGNGAAGRDCGRRRAIAGVDHGGGRAPDACRCPGNAGVDGGSHRNGRQEQGQARSRIQ